MPIGSNPRSAGAASSAGISISVPDLLSQLRIDHRLPGTHRHVSTNFIGVDCPWCSPAAQSWKLGIHRSGRFATCWLCGSKPVVEALVRLSGRPWQEVRGLLGDLRPADGPRITPRGRLALPPGLGPLAPQHAAYLRTRRFCPETLERLWGLQGIGIAGSLSWRIFIPVVAEGQTVSWTTRAIGEQNPRRYISARPDQEAVPIKDVVLGADYVRHAVVICEGPFDAFRIGPGAVCTFGVNVSRAQRAWLSRIPLRVVCLDSSEDAQRRAASLCRELALFPGNTENVVLDAADPGEAPESEVRQLRRLYLD